MERKSGTGRSAEARAFARLMGDLKERSGRSYGALARLLHTSTSTLHRYCNGEALPTEFAVVDRFARACGATRDEAVELHRAWLLADARRRAVVVPVVPVFPVVPAERAERAERADPVERAEQAGPGGPVASGEPEDREEPEPGVAPEPEAAGGSRVPEEVPARWRRGRRLFLSVAVAVAAASALAVGVTALPETGPDNRSPQAGPTATATATKDPAATATAPASPPLRADVRSHVWAAGCDHAYLTEQAPSAVPPPPVEADAPAWAAARGAVHAGTQIVEVTLHGTGPDPVVLEDLEVRVAGRRGPLAWNVYQMSQGCGGALTPAGFAVNLDAPRPLARPEAGNDAGEEIVAPAFPLRVSAAEPAVLRVAATTTGCDCDWFLDLRWSGPTGSGTLRLDDRGRPWRISAAPSGRPVYGYAHERASWGR